MSREREAEIIEVWKAVVDVQIHFNDIGMRIRGMFVTIILALFASLGFLLDKKIGLVMGCVVIQFAVIVPLFGVLGTYLFYFMDRYWYHRLLIGAVKQGIAIEKIGIASMPELNLTKAIGDESPYEPRGFARIFAGWIVSHPKLKATGKLHSDGKIEFFYKSVMVALALTSVLIGIMGGVEIKSSPSNSSVKTTHANPIAKPPISISDVEVQKMRSSIEAKASATSDDLIRNAEPKSDSSKTSNESSSLPLATPSASDSTDALGLPNETTGKTVDNK